MNSIEQLLTEGLEHHRAGRLDDAEGRYRDILARNNGQPDAWHLLGTIAHQKGDLPRALQEIRRAIELDASNATYYCNLGNALLATGQVAAAESSYRQALQKQQAFPLAQFNLAGLLEQTGRRDEALSAYRHAISLKPDFVEAHYNRALIHQERKDWTAATTGYEQTLRLRPDHAEAWNNLGLVLKEQGHLEQALECFRQAVRCRPGYAEAFNNQGVVCRDRGDVAGALDCYARALQLKPDYAVAYNNLGNLLLGMGRPSDAVSFLRRSVELQPESAESYSNLGAALQVLKRSHEAVDCLRAALKLNPQDARAMQSLGDISRDGGDTTEAIACYQRSLQLKPDCLSTLGQLIHQLQHQCSWDDLPALTSRVLEALRQPVAAETQSPLPPFAFLTMPVATSSRDQQQCSSRWAHYRARNAIKVDPWWKPASDSRQESGAGTASPEADRIRVGYLSADFRAHPVADLIVELFESHDRNRFAVTGYSYGPDDGSALRHRIASSFERFVDLRDASLADSIQRIVADRIDILVDLTGFTQHSRTEIAASRPAPVQVNYLGYPSTMGAEFIDYILVDHFIVPADRQPWYTENLVHLPCCYQVNDTRRKLSERSPTRADAGLPETGFVFCSFNSNYKITADIFGVWMDLLRSTPDSVLWLLESNREAPVNLRREAARRGIDPNRLVFAPRAPLPDHLARHQLADLFLDTFPVNAHTTASDSLWAGLPVLTLSGESFVSRVAGSLLTHLGLPELITMTLEDYRNRALALATSPDQLQELRRRLAANRHSMPVFDIKRSTRAIEAAYEMMHALRLRGEIPRPFDVAALP